MLLLSFLACGAEPEAASPPPPASRWQIGDAGGTGPVWASLASTDPPNRGGLYVLCLPTGLQLTYDDHHQPLQPGPIPVRVDGQPGTVTIAGKPAVLPAELLQRTSTELVIGDTLFDTTGTGDLVAELARRGCR